MTHKYICVINLRTQPLYFALTLDPHPSPSTTSSCPSPPKPQPLKHHARPAVTNQHPTFLHHAGTPFVQPNSTTKLLEASVLPFPCLARNQRQPPPFDPHHLSQAPVSPPRYHHHATDPTPHSSSPLPHLNPAITSPDTTSQHPQLSSPPLPANPRCTTSLLPAQPRNTLSLTRRTQLPLPTGLAPHLTYEPPTARPSFVAQLRRGSTTPSPPLILFLLLETMYSKLGITSKP